jgi:hypothetical protein
MSNQFVSSFRELYAVQTEAQGTAATLSVGSDSGIAVIEGQDQDDPSFYGGGMASGGQMTAQVVYADLSARPQKGDTATITGRASGVDYTAQVLDTTEANGILRINLGDNTAQ